jgi:hypothetical protein
MEGHSGQLSSFLTRLSEDSQLQDAYTNDALATMQGAGLPDETIETVLSRDLQAIRAVLEREVGGADFILFMIIFFAPGN